MTAPVAQHLRQRPTARARRWVGSILGGEVVATRRLKGGISTNTRAVTVARPDGSTRKAVLRTFVGPGWITAEPDLAAREAALLEVLEGAGVPAPRLLGVDAYGEVSGSIALLMTLEPGRPVNDPEDRRPWIAGLVEALTLVHAVAPPSIPNLRDQAGRIELHGAEARPLRYGTQVDEHLWSQVVRYWPGVARKAPTLLHDDYHPGNILWSRGRLTSVVDWTGAGFGQPASDVCYLRQDVSLVSGLDAGDEVLAAYEAASGGPVPDRPFWDLLAATRAKGSEEWWCGSYADFGLPVTLAQVRDRLDRFVARALADLG
jgi:aminoglycoside phosphotransferase (APT) family kinase protein